MPYTIQQEKEYSASVDAVVRAVLAAVAGLEGKFISQDPEKSQFNVKFDKTILGKVLGDRTHMQISVVAFGTVSKVNVSAFPVDAVGRKLQFGARKGVVATVMHWFFAHLEHHLGQPAVDRK
jgi:hypothetical protein